jgi:hypothetical protein
MKVNKDNVSTWLNKINGHAKEQVPPPKGEFTIQVWGWDHHDYLNIANTTFATFSHNTTPLTGNLRPNDLGAMLPNDPDAWKENFVQYHNLDSMWFVLKSQIRCDITGPAGVRGLLGVILVAYSKYKEVGFGKELLISR